MRVGVPDSRLKEWLKEEPYLVATDEGEGVAIAAGHYLATGEPATCFMGTNGFLNALDALTSLIIPYEIPIKLVVGVRTEPGHHRIAGKAVKKLLRIFKLKAELI